MRCAVCHEKVERDPAHPPLGLIHSHSDDVYCGTGDGATAILSLETMYERVATLKAQWAEATGENPDDYALSRDDWRAGLSHYEADEIVILLEVSPAGLNPVGKTIARVEEKSMAGRDQFKDTVTWTRTVITLTDNTTLTFDSWDGEVYDEFEWERWDEENDQPIPKGA
jgi:hypothetical protein